MDDVRMSPERETTPPLTPMRSSFPARERRQRCGARPREITSCKLGTTRLIGCRMPMFVVPRRSATVPPLGVEVFTQVTALGSTVDACGLRCAVDRATPLAGAACERSVIF